MSLFQAARPTGPLPVLLEESDPKGVFIFPLASVTTIFAAMKTVASGAVQPVRPSANGLLGASKGQPAGEGVHPSLVVLEVPSFLTGSYAPEVPTEVVAPLGAVDEALKRPCSILREVGLSVEPGFKV